METMVEQAAGLAEDAPDQSTRSVSAERPSVIVRAQYETLMEMQQAVREAVIAMQQTVEEAVAEKRHSAEEPETQEYIEEAKAAAARRSRESTRSGSRELEGPADDGGFQYSTPAPTRLRSILRHSSLFDSDRSGTAPATLTPGWTPDVSATPAGSGRDSLTSSLSDTSARDTPRSSVSGRTPRIRFQMDFPDIEEDPEPPRVLPSVVKAQQRNRARRSPSSRRPNSKPVESKKVENANVLSNSNAGAAVSLHRRSVLELEEAIRDKMDLVTERAESRSTARSQSVKSQPGMPTLRRSLLAKKTESTVTATRRGPARRRLSAESISPRRSRVSDDNAKAPLIHLPQLISPRRSRVLDDNSRQMAEANLPQISPRRYPFSLPKSITPRG